MERKRNRLDDALVHLARVRDELLMRNIGGDLEAAQRDVIEAIRIVNEERHVHVERAWAALSAYGWLVSEPSDTTQSNRPGSA